MPARAKGAEEMFENETRILLVLPRETLDRGRMLAGKATAALKLPVSLQIVLRALIEEGLKRDGDRKILENIRAQAEAIRWIRSQAGRARKAERRSRARPGRRSRVPIGADGHLAARGRARV
jgi:hypothetical protein